MCMYSRRVMTDSWKCLVTRSPPMLASYAMPTLQTSLLAWAATSPAHRVPCLHTARLNISKYLYVYSTGVSLPHRTYMYMYVVTAQHGAAVVTFLHKTKYIHNTFLAISDDWGQVMYLKKPTQCHKIFQLQQKSLTGVRFSNHGF